LRSSIRKEYLITTSKNVHLHFYSCSNSSKVNLLLHSWRKERLQDCPSSLARIMPKWVLFSINYLENWMN